jgi:hypothetical protein
VLANLHVEHQVEPQHREQKGSTRSGNCVHSKCSIASATCLTLVGQSAKSESFTPHSSVSARLDFPHRCGHKPARSPGIARHAP